MQEKLMKANSVVFFGTPLIAAKALEGLLHAKLNVLAVVTKPDSFIGRKHEKYVSEVKKLALANNIPVYQPNKPREIINQLKQMQPQMFVVCAYGKILPKELLDIPQFKAINIHTSLLPRWRGGAPMHHAIMAMDKQTGISLMYMDVQMDAGDIILQRATPIESTETYQSLYQKLANMAYAMAKEEIPKLFINNVPATKQDIKNVTIAKNISREDELIDWQKSANIIEAKIRALYDSPIAYFTYKNTNIKVLQANVANETTNLLPGTLIRLDKHGLFFACAQQTVIQLTIVQVAGKKPTPVANLVNGKNIFNS